MGRRLFDYTAVPARQRAMILAAMVFWTVLFVWGINRFVLQVPQISGPSMSPTIKHGERRLVWLPAYRVRDPNRGEIVAIITPGKIPSVKRVIALPGETVQVRDGRVYVSDQAVNEPYLAEPEATLAGPMSDHRYQVASNCFFLMGDNRAQSTDSRHFGAVPREQLMGKVY